MDYAAEHEAEYFHIMDVLTEQVIDLINAYLDVGAAGFFYCPGGDNPGFCTEEEYEKYVRLYDYKALSAIEGRAWFTMLHICGMSVADMKRFITLPAQALNWEDQSPLNPSLAEVRKITDKVLMGGIDRNSDFYGSNRAGVKTVLKEKTEEAIRLHGKMI